MPPEPDEELFSHALALPAAERARLAHELLRSLDESEEAGAAEAWLVEIERRAREIQTGTVAPVEWSEVRARLRSRWSKR